MVVLAPDFWVLPSIIGNRSGCSFDSVLLRRRGAKGRNVWPRQLGTCVR